MWPYYRLVSAGKIFHMGHFFFAKNLSILGLHNGLLLDRQFNCSKARVGKPENKRGKVKNLMIQSET